MIQKFKADLLILPLSDHKLELVENPIITVQKVKNKSIITNISNRGRYDIYFKNKAIIPPFIDLHFHWHQDKISTKNKENLLEWLSTQTFPEEAKYKNIEFAKKNAISFSKKLLQVGTLGGACFSSNFKDATEFAFKYFKGDFFIGNTLMDQNVNPSLINDHNEIINTTNYLSSKYTNYALTPRFAISTSSELIEKLNISTINYKFIQTHIAENIEEVILTNKLFKNKTYAEVYQKMGLLTDKTILAHAIYLSDYEWKLLKKYNTIIAHCPTSNAPTSELGLDSGLFSYKTADRYKLRWGLASDIGGGPYLSMFDVITSFSRHQKTTLTHGLYRATYNNYKLLNLPLPLTINAPANFLVIPMHKYKNGEDFLQKLTAPYLKNRKMFNHLVAATVYNGKAYIHHN